MRVESAFSETSGSHNELIVVREIPFHRVMKLSIALASFSLPSCYLCVMGGKEWRTDTRLRTPRHGPSASHESSHLCSCSPAPSLQSRTSSAPWSGGLTFTSSSGRSPWSSTTWRRYPPRPPSRTALLIKTQADKFGICNCFVYMQGGAER